jgi:hypothetical protein
MIIVVHWTNWLEQPMVLKFADSAQAQGYVETIPNECTAFTFDTDLPVNDPGSLQHTLTEMCRLRSTSSLVQIHNAMLIDHAGDVKSFHDKETAQRRIGLRILERAEKGAWMKFAPAPSTMVRTPDGMMPAIKRGGKKSYIRETDGPVFRVIFQGRPTSPTFRDKGPARTYLQQLEGGRAPEYEPVVAKTASTGERKPGVIAAIIDVLKNGGGTVDEIFAKVHTLFPERGDGVRTTCSIQVKRLHASGKLVVNCIAVPGRGKVYSA